MRSTLSQKMKALRCRLESFLVGLCVTVLQGCEDPPRTKLPEEKTPMKQFTFTDDIQASTELQIGELLRWHDPEDDEVVLCFKLNPVGEWNYGEFVVIRKKFEWDDLGSTTTIILTEDDLAESDMRLDDDFTFSSVEITIESFSDSDNVVEATITGTAVDENQKSLDFRLSSRFHVSRPEKHANHWQRRLEVSMVERFPSHMTVRHYTKPNDYGLRYGDVYFSEFKATDDELILIQSVFDSSRECNLYVARPDDPTLDSENRTFPFTESGLQNMTAYINREITKR